MVYVADLVNEWRSKKDNWLLPFSVQFSVKNCFSVRGGTLVYTLACLWKRMDEWIEREREREFMYMSTKNIWRSWLPYLYLTLFRTHSPILKIVGKRENVSRGGISSVAFPLSMQRREWGIEKRGNERNWAIFTKRTLFSRSSRLLVSCISPIFAACCSAPFWPDIVSSRSLLSLFLAFFSIPS